MGVVAEVFQTPASHDEEPHHQDNQAAGAVVAAEPVAAESLADPTMQAEQAEVPAQ